MSIRIDILALALLLTAAPVFAQHGHGRSEPRNEGRRPEAADGRSRGPYAEHPRRFNEFQHHRVDIRREVRVVNGRREIFWGGFWFQPVDVWPDWAWDDEVYITYEDAWGCWVIVDYARPYNYVAVRMVIE